MINGTLAKSETLVIISGTGSTRPIPLLKNYGKIILPGTWTTQT